MDGWAQLVGMVLPGAGYLRDSKSGTYHDTVIKFLKFLEGMLVYRVPVGFQEVCIVFG